LIQGEYACFTLPESPVVKTGHWLINISGCRRCHQTGHKGNVLASNLDTSFDNILPEVLADAIKNPAIFMPDFFFQETDVTSLVNAILDSSAVYASKSGELSQVIHFEVDKEDSDNIFSRNCGACHRILTQRIGGIGKGDIGPNLSGLFSDFYFQNFKDSKSWDSNGLEQWLKNPRDIRTNAQMPPVNQKKDELRHLITIMSS
jgi:cytochrome c2